MEKTAEKKTTKKELTAEQWRAAYIEHKLLEGKAPASVFAFAKAQKATEADFYNHFNSFSVLEQSIWAEWMEATVKTLHADDAYTNFTVREKWLAFCFTWLETIRSQRSYVLQSFGTVIKTDLQPAFLRGLRAVFGRHVSEVLVEGKDTGEVAERPFSSQYSKAFWIHFLFITRFWVNDDSKDFEKTDAAVEKSVHLAFDLVGKGALDSMLDFGKFLFQNRK